jgi:hypothetical protein
MASPNSAPPAHGESTNPNLPVMAQTPPTPQPGLRTPSQPMRAQPAGAPHLVKPPPPPADAMVDDSAPTQPRLKPAPHTRSRPAPAVAMPPTQPQAQKSSSRAVLVLSVVMVAAGLGAAVLWARHAPAPAAVVQVPQPPPVAAATPAPAAVEPAPVPVARPAAPAIPTTLVTITSIPSGASVLDPSDRVLGMTPFDLRVPSAQPLQLTLKHDGYRPATLNKQVDGERMSLSVTLKTAKVDGPQTPNRRSVGYKDDPY